jgi:hypothetical protein
MIKHNCDDVLIVFFFAHIKGDIFMGRYAVKNLILIYFVILCAKKPVSSSL